MEPIKIPPYIRASNIALARWQSAVAGAVRKRVTASSGQSDRRAINKQVMADPKVLGTNLHVARKRKKLPSPSAAEIKAALPAQNAAGALHPLTQSYLSEFYFNAAKALKAGEITSLPSPPSEFPDSDQATAEWIDAVVEWDNQHEPQTYTDWLAVDPSGISTFGVIDIPENSKIVILGDFGTGLPDAEIMLMAVLNQLQPDYIIHLGDIYYAGQQSECQAYADAFTNAFKYLPAIPVFSIPGNHEYYSGGSWFYQYAVGLNAANGLPSSMQQQASYFCLRTPQNWQFLAMDTGANSVNGSFYTDLSYDYAPWLNFHEQMWHQYQLENFGGKTVLLSHHQLFSASAVINGDTDLCYQSTGPAASSLTYLNNNLYNVFSPYFSQVAAWFWGHEHILGIFEDSQDGLPVGRLVGNSGYEEWEYDNPAEPTDPSAAGPYGPTDSPIQYTTPEVKADMCTVDWNGTNYEFFQHAFACVQLNGASATVTYYEYPVMSPDAVVPTSQEEINALTALTLINFSDTL